MFRMAAWVDQTEMDENSEKDEGQTTRSPLTSIGLTVLAILMLPIFLYSNGPGGPIKEGDVVFSTGRHRVYFVEPTQYQAAGYQSFCVLEPHEQLIVTQRQAVRSDGSLLARPLGKTIVAFPSCPPNANLILQHHQATLHADTWSGFKDTVTSFFSAN